MKFIVFGLGNFGSSLATQLVSLGHEVIGVDESLERVERYKYNITQTVALDATNPDAVRQLPMNDIDAAVVGIGEDEGALILTAALMKQMNVKRIICRVTSPLQKIVLQSMNIEEFVYPESSSAERLALKLDQPGVIDSFHVHPDYRMVEVATPARYIGRSVGELDLANRNRLVLVTIIQRVVEKGAFGNALQETKVLGIISPSAVLREGDILVLFGHTRDLEAFIEG